MSLATVILAAGKGTRMNSDLPKVMHRLGGAPMFWHTLRTARALEADRIVVVTGHGSEIVRQSAAEFDPGIECVDQGEQLGTGHATAQAAPLLADHDGDVIVLYGDTPFVSTATLETMRKRRAEKGGVVVLGFDTPYPGRYGRLIRGKDGQLDAIIEAKDATPAELNVTLCNSGVVCASAKDLFSLTAQVQPSAATGEYYLTDIVALARKDGLAASVVICDEDETLGVDSREALASAEQNFQAAARRAAFENGATLTAPQTVFFAFDTEIGRDAVIGANVVFGPGVTIESEAEIRAFCHLEGCHVSRGAIVGPFARLRPGAELAEHVHIGNFVEIKNATIDEGAKINHLSYVGDAEIGARSNIGAGAITCNYDGVMKHRTIIGPDSFVGSNTSLVAPVTLGAGSITASGSVIDRDLPDGALGIERSAQRTVKGFAARHWARLKSLKAKQKAE